VHTSAGAKELATGRDLSDLGRTLIESAWAVNTAKQDKSVLRLFNTFALATKRAPRIVGAEVGTDRFREQDDMLVEFVAYMAARGLDHATCKAYILSLGRQFLTEEGYTQVSRHVRPMLAVSGLERIQGATAVAPKPETPALTRDALRQGIGALEGLYTGGRERLRMKAIICMGVAFMMRISELIPSQGTRHYIRWGGVAFLDGIEGKPGSMKVTFPSSKKKKAPEARAIAATWSETCAVRATYEYMQSRRKENITSEMSLFCGGGGMTAAGVKEVRTAIRAVAGKSGIEGVDSFTTKSMRVGGVTSLTEQSEVAGHVIEKHGRWSSETWKKTYQRATKKTGEGLAKFLG
jgi:integrase